MIAILLTCCMKKYFPLASMLAYTLFGSVLLFQMVNESPSWETLYGGNSFQKDHNSGKLIIHQSSKKAVIHVKSPALAEAIYSRRVKVVCALPDSSTLIRIMTGQPTILAGNFKGSGSIPWVESNGKVVVVNGSGINVQSSAVFDWNERENLSTFEIEPNVALLTKQGNVYALAIKKRGFFRANETIQDVGLKLPKLNDSGLAPVITDSER